MKPLAIERYSNTTPSKRSLVEVTITLLVDPVDADGAYRERIQLAARLREFADHLSETAVAARIVDVGEQVKDAIANYGKETS